jgi:peptidoglycan/xylan/chitin deacetylase (PgdA/CDA1 family)
MKAPFNLFVKFTGKYRRTMANFFGRRMVAIKLSAPIISFTFDDAPKSAFEIGGSILRAHRAKATFFISFGLLGLETEVGAIASQNDLVIAVNEGHELGCHTFDHLDACQTSTEQFMASVLENGQALNKIIPGADFITFAYPKNGATLSIKPHLQKRFICCRGGGQTTNVGNADLNQLKACFLDNRQKVDINFVKKLIDYNSISRGWLIFATHDLSDNPSPYGCTPEFFAEVVEYAASSGSLLLPVKDACSKLKIIASV